LNLFAGEQGVQTDLWSTTVAVNQLLPWGGASYSVAWDSSRTTTDSFFSSLNPELAAGLQVGYSQPLLRNFRIDPARAQLEVSRRNSEIANTRLRDAAVTTTAEAERAYWALVAALALVDVQQQALDLALELERTNRARVDVGQSPPLDLVAARAEVAQRRENLIVARTVARQAEDLLRTRTVDSRRDDFWTLRIEPADRVPTIGALPDVEAAVRRALAERTDLIEARKVIQNTETNISLSRNDTLPDLRVQASYLADGAGGTRVIREGGFPGTIVGSQDTSFGSVLGQLFTSDFPTWTLGLSLSYPLGKSTAEANLARSRVERDQATALLRSLEVNAARQVRDAAWRVEQNQQRIETTRLGRELAEQRLDAEQKRFEVGMSTSFLVIQAQRDLAIARNNELQALLDYQLAVVSFEASQQSGNVGLLAQVR
jgi:outer membrane protein TolC